MCGGGGGGGLFGGITRTLFGSPDDSAYKAAMSASNAAAPYYAELAKLGREQFDLARGEYERMAPIREQLMGEAQITPERIAMARRRAVSDVEREHTLAKQGMQRELSRLGVNPGDAAYGSNSTSMAIQKAGQKAAAADTAGRNERLYRTQVGAGLIGRQAPNMSQGAAGVGAAGSGYAGLAGQLFQSDVGRRSSTGFLGIPGLSASIGFARGGKVPDDGAIPMVKRPDGSFVPPTGPEELTEGQVHGPGTETSDSIPAMVSREEYIHPAFSTKAYGAPIHDTMVEIARQADAGVPEAKQATLKIISTVASAGSKFAAPTRVAGQAPMLPPRQGGATPVRAAEGGVMDPYQHLQQMNDFTRYGNEFGLPNTGAAAIGMEKPEEPKPSGNAGMLTKALYGSDAMGGLAGNALFGKDQMKKAGGSMARSALKAILPIKHGGHVAMCRRKAA